MCKILVDFFIYREYCVSTCWIDTGHPLTNLENIMENLTRRSSANAGSALRAQSQHNPRNLPCPTCHEPNRLTPADARKGYQCDECADRAEGGFGQY